MSSLRLRWATLLTAAALTFTGAQVASATTGTATQAGLGSGLTLPDGGIDRPHGGRTPGGAPGDSGVDKDTFCAELRVAMGSSANTPFGMQLLASQGC